MSTEAQKRAAAAYNRRQDNIMIRPDKATGAQIRAAAAAAGKSVQRYILDALTGPDAGQHGSGPDAGHVERPDVAAAEDSGRVRFSIAAAAIADLRGPDETPAAAAVRVFRLGVAAARAPAGDMRDGGAGAGKPSEQSKK